MKKRIISYKDVFSKKVFHFRCVSIYYQTEGVFFVTDTHTITSIVPGIGELKDLLKAILYSVPLREFNGGVGTGIDRALENWRCENQVDVIGVLNGRPEWQGDVKPDSTYEFYAIAVDYGKENNRVTYTLYRCVPV